MPIQPTADVVHGVQAAFQLQIDVAAIIPSQHADAAGVAQAIDSRHEGKIVQFLRDLAVPSWQCRPSLAGKARYPMLRLA